MNRGFRRGVGLDDFVPEKVSTYPGVAGSAGAVLLKNPSKPGGVAWSNPTGSDISVNASGLIVLTGTANVESIIRANSLDQMTVPAANVSWNSQRLTTLGTGIVSTDAPTIAQLVGTSMPYVVSGCVWTADSAGSNRNCSMTSGTVMINGVLLTVAAVTSRAFTASNDTYVDLADNGDGTASITYSAVTNMQTSPALANSGTALNTIRIAVLSVGASSIAANGIGQGAMSMTSVAANNPINAGTQGSTTVAAASNTHAITATPMNVAAITNFPASGGYFLWTSASTSEQALCQYATATGTTLTSVTLLAGRTAATVATGDTIVGVWPVVVCDTLGNRIYRTQPYGGLIAGCGHQTTVSTTSNTNGTFLLGPTNHPEQVMFGQFVVPAGPPRSIRIIAQLSAVTSAAAVGTQLNVNIGRALSGGGLTSWATAGPKVKVVSDGDAVSFAGFSTALLAAGTYGIGLSCNPGSASAFTVGESLTACTLTAEFV